MLSTEDFEGLLTTEQEDRVLEQQQQYGGGVIRSMEVALKEEEISQIWRQAAQRDNRTYYTDGRSIETLEEVVKDHNGHLTPLLSRDVALSNLTIAQRREGTVLRILTVNPLFDEEPPELLSRAQSISVFPDVSLVYSIVPPKLFRRCMTYAYPETIYGALSLEETLAIKGLVSLRDILSYPSLEQAAEHKLIRTDDHTEALSHFADLPNYDGRAFTLYNSMIPESLERHQLLFSHSIDETGTLVVLTTKPPSSTLTTQLIRFSTRNVRYELATADIIQSLIERRANHAPH